MDGISAAPGARRVPQEGGPHDLDAYAYISPHCVFRRVSDAVCPCPTPTDLSGISEPASSSSSARWS
jgi:hypothetical protein